MVVNTKTPYGNIKINDDVIAELIQSSIAECYGVVGLADRSLLREDLETMLKIKSPTRGIVIKSHKNQYDIDVYIACVFGVKISEIVSQVQKRICYVIEKNLGIKLKSCNVYVQVLKEINK